MSYINYKEKYLKYKNKYIYLKNQYGGNSNFLASNPVSIFHAFDMKIADVVKQLDSLADMGFSHIQLSPIQKCRDKIGQILLKKKKLTKEPDTPIWWLAYQPSNYEIGNIYGSKDEIVALIKAAEKKNINIIIDVVINHIRALEEFEYPVYDILILSSALSTTDKSLTFKNLYDEYTATNITTRINNFIGKNEGDKIKKIFVKIFNLYSNLHEDKVALFNDIYKEKEKDVNLANVFDSQSKALKPAINDILTTVHNDILDLFKKIKSIISVYLSINEKDFTDANYSILNMPYYCSDTVPHGYKCWLAQALPQLNQDNQDVKKRIKEFMNTLINMGIYCLRIDAASHLEPNILKEYCSYFKDNVKTIHSKIPDIEKKIYIYSEIINPQGTAEPKYQLANYVKETNITEYNLIHNLVQIFCFQCNLEQLNVLKLPSGDVNSVVFSTTHDLESIDGQPPALSRFGTYFDVTSGDNRYKVMLMICFLLQRIYNVPLVFKSQISDKNVVECVKFRSNLQKNKCVAEFSYVVGTTIFVSYKYNDKNELLGIFFLNVSDKEHKINKATEINNAFTKSPQKSTAAPLAANPEEFVINGRSILCYTHKK